MKPLPKLQASRLWLTRAHDLAREKTAIALNSTYQAVERKGTRVYVSFLFPYKIKKCALKKWRVLNSQRFVHLFLFY